MHEGDTSRRAALSTATSPDGSDTRLWLPNVRKKKSQIKKLPHYRKILELYHAGGDKNQSPSISSMGGVRGHGKETITLGNTGSKMQRGPFVLNVCPLLAWLGGHGAGGEVGEAARWMKLCLAHTNCFPAPVLVYW